MIQAEINGTHVRVKANGTGEELAEEILRTIKSIYDRLVEESKNHNDLSGAIDFRSTIILWVDDALDYEKLLEVKR